MTEATAVVGAKQPHPFKKWLRTRFLEPTLRTIPRERDVLDLCCGYGFYFGINPRATGVDGDARAVDYLRSRGHEVQLANVLERLPFPDGSFRWVIAHDVLEHFDRHQLERVADEVRRVLRPGGAFVVLVPNRKGYEYGVRAGVGHKLFVTRREIEELAAGRFAIAEHYSEPLPAGIGRFFTHNKEVFWLRTS